jgi:hypothetical protein
LTHQARVTNNDDVPVDSLSVVVSVEPGAVVVMSVVLVVVMSVVPSAAPEVGLAGPVLASTAVVGDSAVEVVSANDDDPELDGSEVEDSAEVMSPVAGPQASASTSEGAAMRRSIRR